MTRLAERQARFMDAIYAEGEPAGAAAIYRRNALATFHDALAATYPVVRRLVGEAFFREAAERFSRAHPSTSGDLHRHGEGFATFLAGYPHARGLAYLPDVARLEWLCHESFHAADGRAFDFKALAAVPEAARHDLRLTLQPGFRRMRSEHPVAAIREANQPERDGTPARGAGDDCVFAYRDGFAVRVESVDPLSWDFIGRVADGATLGEIAADETLAARLSEELVRWTRSGVIDGFERR